VTTEQTVEKEIKKTRRNQHRFERKMRHKRRGTKTLEKIAEEEVAAVTTQYEKEKKYKNDRLSIEYTVLNGIKAENQVLITTKTKEATQHRRIKEEAMNATLTLQRKMTETQKILQLAEALLPPRSSKWN
jgi:hypothetical protein